MKTTAATLGQILSVNLALIKDVIMKVTDIIKNASITKAAISEALKPIHQANTGEFTHSSQTNTTRLPTPYGKETNRLNTLVNGAANWNVMSAGWYPRIPLLNPVTNA